MKRVFEFMKWFFYITTCVLIVVAVNIEIAGDEFIRPAVLWQILLSGFLTSFVTILLRPNEDDGGGLGFIKILIHYLVLCVVMIVCGYWFGWLKLNFRGILMMVVSTAVVYLLVYLAAYRLDKRQADEINRELQGKYKDME